MSYQITDEILLYIFIYKINVSIDLNKRITTDNYNIISFGISGEIESVKLSKL